jgi:hypothetical protein
MRVVREAVAARLRRANLLSERGWTFSEVMIASVITFVVLGSATMIVGNVASLNGTTNRQTQAQEKARLAIDSLATQLRNAVGPPGTTPIYSPASGSTGGTTSLIFYIPGGTPNLATNPRGLQWIRYCLDAANVSSETLWTQTAPYANTQSGPPSTTTCPSANWATQQSVATNVVNQECPSTGSPTSLFTPATDAGGVIHDIQVRLLIRVSAGNCTRQTGQRGDQYPTAITSSIDFRNAKSGPTAALSCSAQNKHAVCDASASADPDGEALSYQWKYLCCSPSFSGGDSTWEAGQTSYLFDKGGLTSGSTYALYVQVTDASGLSSTASRNVAIP